MHSLLEPGHLCRHLALLFRIRHIDIARRAEEDIVTDFLDLAVQGIRRAADEVDDALSCLSIRVLEVDDDWLALAQIVRDLLCIVKRLRR